MQDNMDREVDSYLRRKYESSIRDVEIVQREDLDLVRMLWLAKLYGSKVRPTSSK